MKILVVYYSRSERTKQVADRIRQIFQCDIERIEDVESREGPSKFLKSTFESILGHNTEIKPSKIDPQGYDLVIIGTPVWAGTMSSPIFTYMKQNFLKFDQVAFFCTCGSNGAESTLKNMERLIRKEPVSTLSLTKKELKNNMNGKINNFISELKYELT
ncbi:MAG: flavodoxin [Methanobacteriaceae archaeon]|jgi:flavodoxin|uniref:flavodoxin family protein n=1 Tax=Methanobrevibacter TaxID=2172 RepID=UPI002A0CC9CB|nr:flavodoxin [Methanobacteriaceae archaeon]MDD3408130.1 flavodoxin [Methanobacteriaceae archaeon]MDD4593889.1 flavodoxin [Methanobacteriaceae archaeon]